MVEEKEKSARSNFFLCWIVLFDLECSERRALCNIFSTHMADCVTAKHTGGVVVVVVVLVVVVVRCGGVLWQKEWGGGRQTRGNR